MKNNPLAYFVGGAVICAVLLAFVTRDRWLGEPDTVQTAAATTQSSETEQPSQSAAAENESTITKSPEPATTEPAKEPEQQAAAEPKVEPEPAPEPAKPVEAAEVRPSIDNVVVSEDGMAIVSGRAKAGTRLKIMLGEKIVGEAIANGVGDWYLSPEPILPPGEHNLVAVATTEGGEPVSSAPSSKIVVAQKTEPQQTAAAETVETQPAASEQQPAAQEETPAKPADEQQVAAVDTTAKEPEPAPAATPEVKAEPEPAVKSEPEPAPEPKVAAVPEPAPQPDPIAKTSMGLDYNDAGDIIVSGKSEPGSKVRIVIDDKPVGDVLADASGHWSFKDNGKITPGIRDLRADKVLSDGKVVPGESFKVERVDPVKIVQSQPEPAKENETVAIKTPEPAAPATEEPAETKVATTEVQPAATEAEPAAVPEAVEPSAVPAASETEPAAVPDAAEPAQETETAAVTTQTQAVTAQPTAPTPAQGRVVIQPGNNLWNISRVIYGRGIEYTTIYEANKDQISNPHRIYPGQIFMTPGTVPPEEIDPSWRRPLSFDEKLAQ